MQLDFNPTNNTFILYVPRGEADPATLMREHGLDFSDPASTVDRAVLFTREPYAAASFAHLATPRAANALLSLTTAIATSWATDSNIHIAMPPNVELWPFQRASVAYCLDREHALIGDQPGLGKTISAIAIANEIQAERILIVCPASIRYQWAERMQQWALGKKSHSVVRSSRYPMDPKVRWTIISWDLVRNPGLWAALAKFEYDLLVLDEAHMAKHYDARRTRAIFGGGEHPAARPLIECAKKTVALTGTPLPKRPLEAYVLARHLAWESIDFLSQDDFNERFNLVTQIRNKKGKIVANDEVTGREGELQNRMRANFMVRHLKRDVMSDLKYPEFDLIRVDATSAVKQALAAEKLLDIDPETLAGKDATALGHIAAARRLMGIAMAPQVAAYVGELVEGGEDKLVVFAWHIDVLNILEEKLKDYGVIRIDGRDGPKVKDAKVKRFAGDPANNVPPDPRVNILLGNILSLGTGTDGLQHVSCHALLAEADWTHGNNEQCFDRLDRGGQKRQVQGDIFVAPGSIAEKVLAAALRDAQTTHKVLDRRMTC